jgi:hypothetical protein
MPALLTEQRRRSTCRVSHPHRGSGMSRITLFALLLVHRDRLVSALANNRGAALGRHLQRRQWSRAPIDGRRKEGSPWCRHDAFPPQARSRIPGRPRRAPAPKTAPISPAEEAHFRKHRFGAEAFKFTALIGAEARLYLAVPGGRRLGDRRVLNDSRSTSTSRARSFAESVRATFSSSDANITPSSRRSVTPTLADSTPADR